MSEDSGDTVVNSPRSTPQPSHSDVFDTRVPKGPVREVTPVREVLEGPGQPQLPSRTSGSEPVARRRVTPVAGPPVSTPTPTFYSFRIGGLAEPIPLDRPAYIGRRPSRPRILQGLAPRLVRVVSPHQEVSATHLEILQLGTSVIVTDLRSTNGSVVLSPGSVPRKLRQGESVVVVPGTLVDIGDDNILHILPLEHLAAAGSGRSS